MREHGVIESDRADSAHVGRSNLDAGPPIDSSDSQDSTLAQPGGVNENWLELHASELVERLQAWASDLDAREAQLNARSSLQDHRERRFRLQQQDLATELAEQKKSIDRLRREIESQARRLAFQDDPLRV